MATALSAPVFHASLGEVGIRFLCQEPDQLARVVELCRRLFAFEDGPSSTEPTVTIRLGPTGRPLPEPVLGEEISRSEDVRVWRTTRGSFIRSGASTLDLDLAAGHGEGVIAEELWGQPLHRQRGLFLVGLLSLLHARGRFGLHAGAVVLNGAGCLLVGPSGSGKTTLTVALVRDGWSYLSDDVLALRQAPDGVTALAVRRGFSCVPAMASQFAELRYAFDDSPRLPGGKRLVDVDTVYPGRFTPRCLPRAILFPRIVAEQRSRLVPLHETAAMLTLLEQSSGIARSRESAHAQLATLRQLVRQAPSYEILLGADLLADRAAVPTLLARLPRGY